MGEEHTAAKQQEEPRRMEELAAAVALAIDRRRRACCPAPPVFKITPTAGPDEWATSGRLAQVNRDPARDPWNR